MNGSVVVDIKYYNISVIARGGGETTVRATNGSRTRSIVRAEDRYNVIIYYYNTSDWNVRFILIAYKILLLMLSICEHLMLTVWSAAHNWRAARRSTIYK